MELYIGTDSGNIKIHTVKEYIGNILVLHEMAIHETNDFKRKALLLACADLLKLKTIDDYSVKALKDFNKSFYENLREIVRLIIYQATYLQSHLTFNSDFRLEASKCIGSSALTGKGTDHNLFTQSDYRDLIKRTFLSQYEVSEPLKDDTLIPEITSNDEKLKLIKTLVTVVIDGVKNLDTTKVHSKLSDDIAEFYTDDETRRFKITMVRLS